MIHTFPDTLPHAESASQNRELQHRYRNFRSLLKKNGQALQLMADLEADLNFMDYTHTRIRRPVQRIVSETLLMAQELNLLDGNRHKALYPSIRKIDERLRSILDESEHRADRELSVSLEDGAEDTELIGGKAAGLAALRKIAGESVPDGFVLTTAAYRLFMDENDLNERIRGLIHDLPHIHDPDQFRSRLEAARQLYLSATLPDPIREEMARRIPRIPAGEKDGWAVRSSSVQEDDRYSFAGQFDSRIGVHGEDLETAYLQVLASRFSDRAMRYRLDHGFKEIDTPMAVLFMPLVRPRFAGVLYTSAHGAGDSRAMMVNAVPGLADAMVRGESAADTYLLSKSEAPEILKQEIASDPTSNKPLYSEHVPEDSLKALGRMAFSLADAFGYEMDIEWALDREGNLRLLQGRRLHLGESEETDAHKGHASSPIIEQGLTVFPGRAEGPVEYVSENGEVAVRKKGAIVVAAQATPKLASILPHIAGLLVEGGNPASHLATLAREFSVPCMFNTGKLVWKLGPGTIVSMDATRRRVYRGSHWPGLRDRVLARIRSRGLKKASGPLHDAVLVLNLTDPHRSDFKPKNCRSVHDVIRYIHEMSVRSMFAFGDRHNRPWKRGAIPLETPIPIRIKLIDLDGSVVTNTKKLSPLKVFSHPFQALWRGIASANAGWQRRSNPALDALPGDFVEQVMGGAQGPRRPKDTNYFIVAGDYVNFNARFAYHYAMIDAVAGPWKEKNYATFRFQGGGASAPNRERRARFLEAVLRLSGFGVERFGDLVTAWLRYYEQKETETALETLGSLMACARELDTVLTSDDAVKVYTDHFMEGRFNAFR